MAKSKIDNFLFVTVLLAGEILALHGKAMASFLFANAPSPLRSIYFPEYIYAILFTASMGFVLIRISNWKPATKLIISTCTGFLAAISTQFYDRPSSLIFFLQLFIYATACGVIWIEHYLEYELDKDFWKFMFENVLKFIRYILVVYGAMIVILEYISSTNGEKTIGFITTLAYPTIIVLVSIFIIGYWVLIPSWEKYLMSSKIEPIIKAKFKHRIYTSMHGMKNYPIRHSKGARH